jgi:hypothetical protein
MKRSELKMLIREVVMAMNEAKQKTTKAKPKVRSGDYRSTSFSDLPDTVRYGFVVFPDLSIGVVNSDQGHGPLINKVVEENPRMISPTYDPKKGLDSISNEKTSFIIEPYDILYEKGLLTLVYQLGRMYIRGMGNKSTIKMAKDISRMYGIEPEFDRHI